ncbi:hypothetical protein V8E36_003513 [Tilletia maclaganii]
MARVTLKRPPFAPSRRGRIQRMRDNGATIVKIAETTRCSPATVRYTLQRFKETGSHKTHARAGRPPKLSGRQVRAVLRAGAHPLNVRAKFNGQRKTIMVWAAIAYGKKSPLIRRSGTGAPNVNAQRYIDVVLRGPLREFVLSCELEELRPYLVVEDNAAIHNARATVAARVEMGLQRKMHPPLSPDLNPIEKAWRALKAALRKRNMSDYSQEAVWRAAQEEWDNLGIAKINKYIDDMPGRVAVVRSRYGKFAE